jgi:hypothetical protein
VSPSFISAFAAQAHKSEEDANTFQVEVPNPDQPERRDLVSLPRFPSNEFIERHSPPVEVLADVAAHDDDEDDYGESCSCSPFAQLNPNPGP